MSSETTTTRRQRDAHKINDCHPESVTTWLDSIGVEAGSVFISVAELHRMYAVWADDHAEDAVRFADFRHHLLEAGLSKDPTIRGRQVTQFVGVNKRLLELYMLSFEKTTQML